ncbi:zinc finger, CCHC-type containing protein, partial [Tanacetum coccineum]
NVESSKELWDSLKKDFKHTLKDLKEKLTLVELGNHVSVARISAIRLLIDMASIHNLIIHQMDVKTTFFNGDLEEEIYMNQPQGFIMPGNENKERIKKTKRSKNDQKPTRNESDKSNSEESAKDQSRISPTQQ